MQASAPGCFGLRPLRNLAAVLSIAVSLSACLSVPAAQTDAMVTATDAVKTAADTILSQLNAAEKRVLIDSIAKAGAADFVPKDAALYSTLDTVAPNTAILKGGVEALSAYAALVQSLAEGGSAAAEASQIKAIVDNVSGLPGISAGTTAAFTALLPVVNQGLVIGGRLRARSTVAAGKDKVHDLIAALRDATAQMFEVLTYPLYIAHKSGTPPPDIAALRVKLSDYVVLLDRLQETFDRLADAYANPNDAMSMTALVQASAELSADAKIVRTAFGAL